MKKILLAAVVLSSAFLFSCNSGGNDPKAVLGQFFEALSKKDIATARKLCTAESKSMLDMMEMGMKMGSDKETEKYDKSKMEMGDAKIEGDKATVPVKEKTSGETINYSLKKEGGSWKVAFDKASMMNNMGMDKMNEGGTHPADELKNLNMDSVKEGLNKGMEALDSANKKMNN